MNTKRSKPASLTMMITCAGLLSGVLLGVFEAQLWHGLKSGFALLTNLTFTALFGACGGFLLAFVWRGIDWVWRSYRRFLNDLLETVGVLYNFLLIALPVFTMTGFLVLLLIIKRIGTVTNLSSMMLIGAATGISALALPVLIATLTGIARIHWLKGRAWSFRPVLFFAIAFPLPWLLIPYVVLLFTAQEVLPIHRVLSMLVTLALTPVLFRLMSFSAVESRRVPQIALVLLGISVLTLALGIGYSKALIQKSPLAATVSTSLRFLLDFDRDGQLYLFEKSDINEFDAHRSINARMNNKNRAYNSPTPAFRYPKARRLNVLFLLVDALRADRLSSAKYRAQVTRNLAALGNESLFFSKAIAQSSTTGTSLPSILAGRYPEYIQWHKPNKWNMYPIAANRHFISDVLRDQGYVTAAFVSAWVKRHIPNFGRHFQHYIPLYPKNEWKERVRYSSSVCTSKAIAFLETLKDKTPWFLFLHFEEPHEPYVEHGPPGRSFGKSSVKRYDSDVHYADTYIGVLLDYLKYRRWRDDTVIIVTSDHGEEFGEHGKKYHNYQLYQESIHVPLLLYIPGEAHRNIDETVALVDIAPTIVDLLGIDADRTHFQGVSLLHYGLGQLTSETRPIFSMLWFRDTTMRNQLSTVLSGQWKLIVNHKSKKEELYNLKTDPGEKQDRSRDEPNPFKSLKKELDLFLNSSPYGMGKKR